MGRKTNLELENPLLSAYAKYGLQSNNPRRFFLTSLCEWDAESASSRGSSTLTLSVGSAQVSLQHLQCDSGSLDRGFDVDSTEENVRWAGEQCSFEVDSGSVYFLLSLKRKRT